MPTVLIVDDTPVDLVLLEGILKKDPQNQISKATNGLSALEMLQKISDEVDVVVTDLNMPEMNGLELVNRMQSVYPQIPVVLTTAHGSEELAVEALQHGAACYVPKTHLAERLVATVQQVRAMSAAQRNYERLTQAMSKADFEFQLTNDPALCERLVEMMQQIAGSMGLCEASNQVRLGMALEGALFSAYYRGNLELDLEQIEALQMDKPEAIDLVERRRASQPYASRVLRVQASLSRDHGTFVIRHEGPGIDVASIPEPNDPHALDQLGNRGLVLMQAFMDEAEFDSDGTTITMVKRRAATSAPA
ncbi:MAG: response regulator [Blastopirellula sp. JB062]